ncbi:hypothetical protein MCUN1_000884 [Malassezia cuniculi]|uniref:SLC26A/SulP transporter domain-containing protein n=1 Tax=Malassezia cuniculi TaxID=948313 RepID=A0AAF0EP85_9BASI|nr:hypothetical protein MCUN1_000884 [Malassezia cuniculi]
MDEPAAFSGVLTAPSIAREWWSQARHKPRVSLKRTRAFSVPAIILATLINIFDAASMGLLVFPTGSSEAFEGLQSQSIAIFLLSTIVCQLVFVLGGTNFPQAQGAMLIEVLPFMQTMATKLSREIDDKNALLATTVVSYAISSIVLGVLCILLGLFKTDRWIAYVPEPVLVGALGAIGLSLFLSGFDVTQRSTFEWNAQYIRGLFTSTGTPVMFCALCGMIVLCTGVRIKRPETPPPRWKTSWHRRITWDLRKHISNSFFVPGFIIVSAIAFWIGAGASRRSLMDLENSHWLFAHVPPDATIGSRMQFYEFWMLYDFKIIRWDAIRSIFVDIIILVIIGAINLPIYYPALRESLPKTPRTATIQKEFLGHGISNILSGAVGSLPNLIVLSNSIFFTRAGGGRFESYFVLFFTTLFFIFSKLVLPYIPTLCAAQMVYFIGVELMAEALIPTWKTKSLLEYLVIVGTMVACTALGFAQGVGVGLAATLAALGFEHLADYEIRTCFIPLRDLVDVRVLSPRVVDQISEESSALQIGIISLSGHAGYTAATKVREAVHAVQQTGCAAIVLDLTRMVRIDIATATQITEERGETHANSSNPPGFLIGVPRGTSRYQVLERADLVCADPLIADAATVSGAITRGLWAVDGLLDVVNWLSSRMTATRPRLPRWARQRQDSPFHSVSPSRHPSVSSSRHASVSSSRQSSVDIYLGDLRQPKLPTVTIDPTLDDYHKWRACWEQLCCNTADPATPGDMTSILSDYSTLKRPLVASREDSFVPQLEKYGRIVFHEPGTLLSSAGDPVESVHIVVVGSIEMRILAPPLPSKSDAVATNPAQKVDLTPADWLRSAYRFTRRKRIRIDEQVYWRVNHTLGDVIGLAELHFAEPWRGDVSTAGHLSAPCITIEFDADTISNVPELAFALDAYHLQRQYRVNRLQEIYRSRLHQGQQYSW